VVPDVLPVLPPVVELVPLTVAPAEELPAVLEAAVLVPDELP